jgi:DNA-binding NtrC family response regulator
MTAKGDDVLDGVRNDDGLDRIIGTAPAFLAAVANVRSVGHSDGCVLLSGETGTGKELVARAIHYVSPRAAHPFAAVNCGSLVETLLEDELFGHERGAFTDAHARRPGLLAQADGGTAFLDEVDVLTGRAQVALLRVLQEGTFRSLGGTVEQHVNVRFIAATNASLGNLVREGKFRADLYYRLCVFEIRLPPLRDRREDILPLAIHFIRKHAPPDRPRPELSAGAAAALVAFDWLGNVRELENAIFRAVHVRRGNTLDLPDLGLALSPARVHEQDDGTIQRYKDLKRQAISSFEREYLTRLMTAHRGNVSRAAKEAGKERRDFGRLLKKHGLHPQYFNVTIAPNPPSPPSPRG